MYGLGVGVDELVCQVLKRMGGTAQTCLGHSVTSKYKFEKEKVVLQIER